MKKIQTNKVNTKQIVKDFKADQERFGKKIQAIAKKGKGKAIKEEIHHKVKAGDRRREINLLKDNKELIEEICDTKYLYALASDRKDYWEGEYSKEKARNKKYKRMFWTAVGIIIAIPIIYVGIIAIIDLNK